MTTMKLKIPETGIGDTPVKSTIGQYSVSSEFSSHNDDREHWQLDENSSQASSTWSSSTQPNTTASYASSHDGLRRKQRSATIDSGQSLPPPVLVYHESARSIVFRDSVHKNGSSEQVASILMGSVPKPSQTGRQGTKHASFLSERPPPSNKSRYSTSFLSERTPGLYEYNSDDSVNIPRSFGRDFKEAKFDDDHGDHNVPKTIESSSTSGPLVLDEIVHRSSSYSVDIKGFQPQIEPLPRLQLGRNDEFEPLIFSAESQNEKYWTPCEEEVYHMLKNQRATVKTIKNTDWTSFLQRFKTTKDPAYGEEHRTSRDDIAPHHGGNDSPANGRTIGDFPYNSFVTSTTLLPSGGLKMRAYGTTSNYTTGCVFALPNYASDKEEAMTAKTTHTWSWPSGYSAKTEFNIDGRGNLINGREEALVPLPKLREMNDDYVNKSDYVVGGRVVKGGLKTVPYNEVFLRVGGRGRIDDDRDYHKEEEGELKTLSGLKRSFEKGVGLPIAIFCRTASFGNLFSLLRTRARFLHTFGEKQMKGLPLLLITPDLSVRVLTEKLQHDLLKVAARHLNPFQNSLIAHKTKINDTDPDCMQTKLEELIDLDDKMRETLTPEELARIAGGFGATDDSVAKILRDAMVQDRNRTTDVNNTSAEGEYAHRHELQDIVNEGLAASVRASDYYTSRQLLILYSLVSSEAHVVDKGTNLIEGEQKDDIQIDVDDNSCQSTPSRDSKAMLVKYQNQTNTDARLDVEQSSSIRPPPPPLDTDRLRSATNSDGLLAVLGAAQILRAMQDGGAKKRTKESWEAVEEWVEQGERNIAFRLASWRDQRAAQDDLEIAVDQDCSFMAFVSGKAISNRKNFARQLHQAVEQTDFNNMRFLLAIDEITNRMHSPCLRLELLQYVLGLDNRYSIEHVKRAVELAATCLNISSSGN